MERTQLNRIALALAVVAALASLASIGPLSAMAASLLAVLGFAALVAAIHLVRPSQEPLPGEELPAEIDEEPDEEAPEAAETTDEPEAPTPHVTANIVGMTTAVLMVLLGAMVAAALMTQVADVRYLGPIPVFLADHFTVLTGPMATLLALAPILAAQGQIRPAAMPAMPRRAAAAAVHGVSLLASLIIALDLTPLAPAQAPYLLAINGVLAWLDAVHLDGLPSPGVLATWLGRGDTEQSRSFLKFMAVGGNLIALLIAVAGAALHVMGFTGLGVLAELVAIALLLATTYASSTLRTALPIELEEDFGSAQQEVAQLRLLALGPLFATAAAGMMTLLAFLGVVVQVGGLAGVTEFLRPAIGGLVAVLAGINIARARLRSPGQATPVRRAVWVVAASILGTAAFFSLIIHSGVMTGPIVESGIGLVFDFTVLMAGALYVAARGLYPMPWSELRREEKAEVEEAPEDFQEKLERSLLTIYIASGLFIAGVIGLFSMIMFGGWEVALPESTAGRNAAFLTMVALGLLLILGLAVVYFQSRRIQAPETEGVDFKKRYTPSEVARLAVLGLSVTLAVVMGLLGVLVLTGQLASFGPLELESKHSTDFFVFAILIGMGPAGYLYNRERKRISAIDAQLPEFLRDLAESQRTGMTLTQAVITASRGNYGALTPEVQKMAAQIEWGVSFEDALSSFSRRVDTPLVQRTTRLIIEAQNSGGNVIDVLMAASEDAREIQKIESERKGGMQIYVMIIYIAFLVFLGVIAILNVKFMPEVAKAVAGASGVTVGSITFQEFDIQAFQTLFFHAAVIQGLGGGFVAGSMEEGKPVAGLKHAFAMVIIAYVTFRFLLG